MRKNFGYTRAARRAKTVSPAEYEYDLLQMRTGLLRPSDKDFYRRKTKQAEGEFGFEAEARKRMAMTHKDILRMFPTSEVPRGEDGILFFFQQEAMFDQWNEKTAYSFTSERWDRMDDECNWDEETEYESGTLYNELFFQ